MFPIIPQYLAGKATTDLVIDYSNAASVVEYRAANVISPRDANVIVSSVIEKNLESDDIEIGEILSSRSTKNLVEKIQIFSFNDKILCSANCWSWLLRTHLAEDCHSYNVELITSSSSHLRIRATRRILPEERLILWFSRDLIATLQIPYLTLNNIRGESQYICHKCKFQCEWPNPLKIHLSLECGKLSRKDLWKRLQRKDDSATNFTDTINSVIPGRATLEIEKTHSAFKPYAKSPVADVRSNTNKMLLCPLSPEALLTEQKVPDFSQSMLYKQAVEMEAIVSHMGRIKQGHLCIYCGKIYSRKYGLKIHIRTHTGFKPLKCKFCLRPFGDPSNLNKHVRLHSEGDTPYKCELCNKILVRKRDLDRHMKSRH